MERGTRFTTEIKEQIRREQRGLCDFCSVKPDILEIHHIIPRSEGGMGVRHNGVGLCPHCHEGFNNFALKDHLYYYDVITMKTLRRAS